MDSQSQCPFVIVSLSLSYNVMDPILNHGLEKSSVTFPLSKNTLDGGELGRVQSGLQHVDTVIKICDRRYNSTRR